MNDQINKLMRLLEKIRRGRGEEGGREGGRERRGGEEVRGGEEKRTLSYIRREDKLKDEINELNVLLEKVCCVGRRGEEREGEEEGVRGEKKKRGVEEWNERRKLSGPSSSPCCPTNVFFVLSFSLLFIFFLSYFFLSGFSSSFIAGKNKPRRERAHGRGSRAPRHHPRQDRCCSQLHN